jgi:hypothetical protein
MEEIDSQGYFAEERGGFDNTVVHSKFVGENTISDQPFLDCRLSDGTWFRNGATILRWQNGYGFSNGCTKYYYFRIPGGRVWTLCAKFATIWRSIQTGDPKGHYPYFTFIVYYYDEDDRKVHSSEFSIRVRWDSDGRNGVYTSDQEWLKPAAATMQSQRRDWRLSLFKNEDDCFDSWLSAFWPYVIGLYNVADQGSQSTSSWSYTFQTSSYTLPDETMAKRAFALDEPEIFFEHLDPVLLGKDTDFSGYWRNWLIQHAFVDACQNLPRLNDNSLANIAELCSFIYNLVVKHQIEIPKSLSDAWLSYRYQFSTGKSDAQEAIEFVHRHMDLGSLDKGITSYGTAFTTYNGVDVSCRCKVIVVPRELGTLDRIWRSLYTYGLQPDFYVVWDMIPYSFIFDWFIPVGDMTSVLDVERMYTSGIYYDFKRICYSLSYDREIENKRFHCYTRWPGSVPSSLNELYWLDRPDASHKTVGYRILDTLSLFIGR